MLPHSLPSRARLLVLPYARSANHGHVLGLRSLSSAQASAFGPAYDGEHHRPWDEEGRAVKATVWWDFQMCQIPPGVSPLLLGPRITAALRGAGIRGPVEINAFGDVALLPRDEQTALADTGVTFSHVSFSGQGSCDRLFMANIIYWIAQNPPPVHFFLISGDKEFANILHRLRMSNYNILIACPEVGSQSLRSAATLMWPWEALVKGVDLTPKHVNQPPDGLSGSWYEQYRGPVDTQLLKSKDLMAIPQNTMVPRVPKSVIKGIKKVLRSHPEGINLTNLGLDLTRANVFMDKKYFGYKKLSALLQAMPDVKFTDPLPGDNQLTVVGDFKIYAELSEQDGDGIDSNQSTIEVKHLNETESEEMSSGVSQSSSSELSSCTQMKTLEADAPSSPSDPLSSIQRETPDDLTKRAEPHSNREEANALSKDQSNAQAVDLVARTELQIRHTEADTVAAAVAPTSGAHGDIGKKGLLGRILSLWNGLAH